MTGITATDLFCGAGGSSTGLVAAGMRVEMAANHWRLAIETHSTNHPTTEHDCADLREAHPANYPSTDVLWASPECTNHSLAKGRKRKNLHQLDLWGEKKIDPAEERSRATMREVVEFSAYHRYKVVIVENVVDIRYWAHYEDWIEAMSNLGYDHKALYLNAQFFGVPQSRDRVYIVFWLRGMKAPDLDFRVPATCPTCGEVEAYQWFKKSPEWGRYGDKRQYLYRCEKCKQPVHPHHTPAATAIDWTLPVTRIADRAKPLQPKTLQRIEAGLRKLVGQPFALDTLHSHAAHNAKVSPLGDPLPTQTTRQSHAVALPMYLNMKGPNIAESVNRALGTVTTKDSHALIAPAWLTSLNHSTDRNTLVSSPMPTIMTQVTPSLVTAPWLLTLRQSTEARSLDEPMTTVTAGGQHHGLVYPWIMTMRQDTQHKPVSVPLSTITSGGNKGGINHALIYSYYNKTQNLSDTDEALPAIMSRQKHYLLSPAEAVMECGFRMLEPHELQAGMGFPSDYIVLGGKRDRVRQLGNAVCCPVAYAIAQRVTAALLSS